MTLVESQAMIVPQFAQQREYWRETLRPFCNLVFLMPFLISYELGIWFFGNSRGESIRNGADAWLRIWLSHASVQITWLPPMILLGILLSWHLITRQPWKLAWDTLGGMTAESLLYAFILIMLGQLTDYGFRHARWTSVQIETQASDPAFVVRFITFMGAGIYEEFLFRLCLLPIAFAGFRALFVPKHLAITGTVILTSLVFSLAHYLSPSGDGQMLAMLTDAVIRVQSSRELWFGFVFRTLAGMFFAALYFLRGFGITVGTHATYDVFVGVILIGEI